MGFSVSNSQLVLIASHTPPALNAVSLSDQTIVPGVPKTWDLPDFVQGTYPIVSTTLSLSHSSYDPYFSEDSQGQTYSTIQYDGQLANFINRNSFG